MSRRFRILVVTNAYAPRIGGISRYLSDVVSGLEKHGVSAEVSSMPEPFNRLDEAAKGSLLWWRTVHLLFVTTFLLQSLRAIIRLRKSEAPLIVHTHSASFCLFIGVLSKLLGSPTVHTFHSPLERPSAALRVLASKSDVLVFVSRALRDLYGKLDVSAPEIRIIPGAVDTSRFRPPNPAEREDAREALRAWFKGPLGEHVILFVGRVVPEKGVHVLLAACPGIFETEPRASVLIVGPSDMSGAGRNYLSVARKLVGQRSLEGRVALSGPLPAADLLMAYWAADVLVCPSTWPEPAAVVVSEAMACGLPVVASSVGGLRERIDEGVTGFLVPSDDPQALAQAVLRVLGDRPIAEELSAQARVKAVRDLGVDLLLDRHLELYDSLVARGAAKAEHKDDSNG